jgi:hypothetical protein
MVVGDCGAFTYRNLREPPYRAFDTAEFYADGGFTHGCSPDHLIFDFDEGEGRSASAVGESIRSRYDVTLQYASEFLAESKRLGARFTPMGVIQGWSAPSMAAAAKSLTAMGYDYLAVGGTVPLKIDQLRRALAAVRDAVPGEMRLHLLGFGKVENLSDLERFDIASFDTTAPLVRAFKDARKNYWARGSDGELSYYTAIRVPQAIENNRLKQKALEGRLDQERAKQMEEAALSSVRAYAGGGGKLPDALEAVMAYWGALNWDDEVSPQRRTEALERQRASYERTLADRPWEQCSCRVCREGGIEVLLFRSSNRNKRRGIHNLHVFHTHLNEHRGAAHERAPIALL